MNRLIAICTLILTSLTCTSQNHAVDAIYFDKDGNPYKIEHKFTEEHSITYVRHDNSTSVCVKRLTNKTQDTTIVQETYYSIAREKTKVEKFSDCDSWVISTTINGDTVTVTGYIMDEFVGDTILTGEAAKEGYNFPESLESVRVPMILNDKINITLDSLTPNESFQAYYVDGLPVKIEWFNSRQEKHAFTTCVLSHNMMVCQSYFHKENLELYQTDTIKWNNDTTLVRWNFHRPELHDIRMTLYEFDDKKMTIRGINGTRVFEFRENKNMFLTLLMDNLLYNDVLYHMELRLFDRYKTIEVISDNGQLTNNVFTVDEQDRIILQATFQDQELQRRIVYQYPNE